MAGDDRTHHATPSLLHTLVSQCACVDRAEGGGEQRAGARGG